MGLVATPQFRIEDGAFLAFVDLYIEEHQLAIEFDGFVKYGRLDPLATQPLQPTSWSPRKSGKTTSASSGTGFYG